jgi:hypothetical protein
MAYGPPPGYGYGMYHQPPAPMMPQCRACGAHAHMVPYSRVSGAGWFIVIGLCFLCLIPFNFLGLLLKERGLKCTACLYHHKN